jgi:hypothetical protein
MIIAGNRLFATARSGSFHDARPRKPELAVTDRPRIGRARYNMKQLCRPTMIFLKRILG